MRISRGWAAVVLIAALAMGGCSADGSEPSGAEGPGPDDGSSATEPSPAPTPTRFTAEQLGAALPQGRKQLHGIAHVAFECRDLTKPCNGFRGWAVVDARSDPEALDLVVTIRQKHDQANERLRRRQCPDGEFHRPLRWQDDEHTRYTPGERAQARRIPLTIGEWSGFVCQKTGVLLWPRGETSERHTWQTAYLTNGLHDLTTAGRTLAMTKALAREYLARLSVGAGLTGTSG
ncbi:hypothetical protein [Nocardioides sp.]|uniref:hypothetical protein n=1 Tax=Nocardioides sp. TaxID=35761 RepID=UPI002EDA9624